MTAIIEVWGMPDMLEWLHQMILHHSLLFSCLISGWLFFAGVFLAGAIWLEIVVHGHFAKNH
jgi:hypothetical protein